MNTPNAVLAENLFAAVKEVKITKKSSFPILNHARMTVRDNEITLTTTDLENVRIGKCRARTEEPFETCVPMYLHTQCFIQGKGYKPITTHPFFDWCKVMNQCGYNILALNFDPRTQILTITTSNSRTEFKCLDAQEFPAATE